MSRIRLILLSMLAVFAASAVASASASAHALSWEVNGALLAAGATHEISNKVENDVSTLTGSGVEFECKKFKIDGGWIEGATYHGAADIEFKECKINTNAANCEIPATLTTKGIGANAAKGGVEPGVSELTANGTKIEFEPGHSTPENDENEFIAIKVSKKAGGGACLQAKTYKVTGTASANCPHCEEDGLTQQVFAFTATSGSNLKVAGNPATFLLEADEVELAGVTAPEWSASE